MYKYSAANIISEYLHYEREVITQSSFLIISPSK